MSVRRADDSQYPLLVGGSATGAAVPVKGGEYHFMVDGTASGTTASLQIQTPSGAWTDVQVFTGAVVKFTTLPGNQSGIDLPACNVRCALTGGTPSGINAYLVGLG
jgi:hypothetical protein